MQNLIKKTHECSDLQISWKDQKVFPSHRILIIADANNPPIQYIDLLSKLGYDMIWVGGNAGGIGSINVKLERFDPKPILYPEMQGIIGKEFPFSLQGLLDFINMDFSLILHFQNHWMPIDRTKSPIPYIYIPSEVWNPMIPFCAHACTYSNIVMREMIEKYHPNIPILGFLPYPLNLWMNDTPFPTEKYTYELGFSGRISTFHELYEERRRILLTLKNKIPNRFKGHWEEYKEGNIPAENDGLLLEAEKYKTFLTQCKFGLSVPTNLGIPFRDLEVMAAGRCLITKKVRDHAALGFQEGTHYLAYSDENEIIEYLNHISDEEASLIAKRAHSVVHNGHISWYRIPMLEIILERFGVLPHGKTLGLWKEESVKKGLIEVSIKKPKEPLASQTILIGKDIYQPMGD